MKYLLLLLTIAFNISAIAQISLTVEVSSDTIGLEDAVKVTYKLSGAQEQIDVQPWEGFQQVAGPNVSSSFSYVNGVSSQEYSESYILVPKHEGTIYIPSAVVLVNGETLETESIAVFVVAESTYQTNKKSPRQRKAIGNSSNQKEKIDDEEEYQRLLKKRALAKKKKKF